MKPEFNKILVTYLSGIVSVVHRMKADYHAVVIRVRLQCTENNRLRN